uniref:Uncharacterized protein n=1 Tax=Arundo donax TaxID=35708 RepID=A0A0A9GD33_ARUDO
MSHGYHGHEYVVHISIEMDMYSYLDGDGYVGILNEEVKYNLPYMYKSVPYLMQVSF